MTNAGYTDGSSVFHRMDAYVKMLCFILYFTAVILSDGLWGFMLTGAVILISVRLSGIGMKKAAGGIWRMKYFFIFIILMNFAFHNTDSAFYTIWIFSFSSEGLFYGIKTVIRLTAVMLSGNLLIGTTTPLEITGAIETFIYPLKFIGVPVRDVSMILGVSMQFVPIFIREADNIRTAQTARGAPFQGEGLIDKAKSFIPLLVPVFLTAFKRADELASAMEARGYERKKGKLKLKKRTLRLPDIIAPALSAVLLVSVILIKKFL